MQDTPSIWSKIIEIIVTLIQRWFTSINEEKAVAAAIKPQAVPVVPVKVNEPVKAETKPTPKVEAPKAEKPVAPKADQKTKEQLLEQIKANQQKHIEKELSKIPALPPEKKAEAKEVLKAQAVVVKKPAIEKWKSTDWIPMAIDSADYHFSMPTQGRYNTPTKNPIGATVHFTAGRSLKGLEDAIATAKYGAEQKFCYLTIASTGEIIQAAPLGQWGYHAGKSYWPGLGHYVHDKILGIEICNAGNLTWNSTKRAYVSWFGEVIPNEQVHVQKKDDGNIKAGFYHKYTDAQLKTLKKVLLEMAFNIPGFKLELVLGHDEIAPGRKTDPGGAFGGKTMREFRLELIEEFKYLKGEL